MQDRMQWRRQDSGRDKGGRGDLEVASWEIPPYPALTKGGRGDAGSFLDTLLAECTLSLLGEERA